MSTWIWSGYTALYAGGVLFALILAPLLAWQHRRYGGLNPARLLGGAALTLYLVALVTYTWLPLPPRTKEWCAANGVDDVLVRPFHFIPDVRRAIETHGVTGAVTVVTVMQVVFNVLLFVPWGVIVRGFLHRGVLVATASGFAASLLVESTQGTGLWGIYPCAYRTADIDDILTNTTGALIGALLAPALVWWMPRARALSASRLQPRPVTVVRRWTGMLIDAFAVFLLSTVITVIYRIIRVVLGLPAIGASDDWLLGPTTLLSFLAVFWWPAWHGGAAGSGSAGHNAVWLTPVWHDGPVDGSRVKRLVRASVVPAPFMVAAVMPDQVNTFLVPAALLWAGLAVMMVPLTAGCRSLSGVLTRTTLGDIRSLPAAADPQVSLHQ